MSKLPDSDFDLEKLFLPAWAQEEPSSAKYAKYDLPEQRFGRSERRGFGGRGRTGQPGGGRDESRPRGERRGPRPEGGARGPGHPGRQDRGRGPRGGAERPEQRREPPAPLPEISVSLVPDEKGVESLARQIKMTGRAYPLFDIAQMVLAKPERHSVSFAVRKNAEGKPIQPLFLCALDDTLWLSEDEAVSHVLRRHFATFYQTEKTATEPPKGKYTFVAQCGLSGVVLGPPNYHDYQNQLRKLHAERFSRMPFETYKSRVKIVRDEEVVKKWVEDQSWKLEYTCLNLPEPLRLTSMEAVEAHFRQTHKENIIKQVDSYQLSGTAARNLRSPELARLVRTVAEDQRRFPLQIATVLSQQFASHGLQFFKVNKTVTHVCIARPHYLDLAAAPVSEGIKQIVQYIDAHPRCTRRQLVESLAPTPAAPAAPAAPAQPSEGAPAAAEATPAVDPNQPTAEQTAVIADLHWLIHQGHVIEFANGILETAKKPAPKPPRPEKPAKPAEPAKSETPSAEPQSAAAEQTPQPVEAAATAAPAETPAAAPSEDLAPATPSASSEEATAAGTVEPTESVPAETVVSVPPAPPSSAEESASETPKVNEAPAQTPQTS